MYTGRFAPSPTGFLHLGHAATFLAAARRAQEHAGTNLLRIDDLDRARSKEVYIAAAREDLHWLGLHWTAEFRQSERIARYEEAMRTLLSSGSVYPCTCSRKDLQQAVQAPHEEHDEPLYPGHCRPQERSGATHQSAAPLHGMNYRFHVQDGTCVRFNDLACGPQSYTAGIDFGDFLVWRKDGLPSYQLACVMDDAESGVTEVVRGRDLLKSTARQIVLQRALHLVTPAYFHTALLRDEDGSRLAKRHDALSLRALRESGATSSQIYARVGHLLHHNAMR